jgi:hypothetical protein
VVREIEEEIGMRQNLIASPMRPWRGLIPGLAALLGVATSGRASADEVRHVQVQSLLGQVYDAVIGAEDAESFGLSIPRGTALPRRLYPVGNLGVPMIHELRQPRYRNVLLHWP